MYLAQQPGGPPIPAFFSQPQTRGAPSMASAPAGDMGGKARTHQAGGLAQPFRGCPTLVDRRSGRHGWEATTPIPPPQKIPPRLCIEFPLNPAHWNWDSRNPSGKGLVGAGGTPSPLPPPFLFAVFHRLLADNYAARFGKPSPQPCDPEITMKWLLAILAIVILLGSLLADYKWRQWMAARKRDRQ